MRDTLSSPSVVSHYGWGESILITHKPTLLTDTTCSLISTGNLSRFALRLGLISTTARGGPQPLEQTNVAVSIDNKVEITEKGMDITRIT